MPTMAHTRNDQGHQQGLLDHLRNVAELAATFAIPFQGADQAYLAGLLHDIGKFDPAFQHYLRDAEAGVGTAQHGPDHKGAGAVLALEYKADLLPFVVQGHHGGLHNRGELREWVRERSKDSAVQAAIHAARGSVLQLQGLPQPVLPSFIDRKNVLQAEFFIRMLFSALVDADFLDTERHFQGEVANARGTTTTIRTLAEQFEQQQAAFSGKRQEPINVIRHAIYEACLASAELSPGFFRLTVPTGGGKTRSSLGFALRHAAKYGQTRIIYAIPFTTITDQIATEFRKIFPNEPGILEHHSAVRSKQDVEIPNPLQQWARLAAENWDAPLIVTTTVQLFESLLANSTSQCRKLHRIANSVIILDETQSLPPQVLDTILSVLRELVDHYGVTVVLCTATQPAFDPRHAFTGLAGIREIIADPAVLFAQLKRVDYRWPQPGERWSWARVAAAMRAQPQALTIVNTRADAALLLYALDDEDALHLSTWMCGAHRRHTLDEVRRRLKAGVPCRLVSTQVIEAGVDVDFPLGLRALGPLDSIAQAAGRVNREGRLPMGEMIVFEPEEGHLPMGTYRTGVDETRGLLPAIDMHDPAVFQRYFARYYDLLDLDSRQVNQARKNLDFPKTADKFRMIPDATTPVLVDYLDQKHPHRPQQLREELARHPMRARTIIRAMQPYLVSLRDHELQRANKAGLVEELFPGLWQWLGRYDTVRGIELQGGIEPTSLFW